MTLLEVCSLTKEFGGIRANDDISFSVAKGELVGLIGPNGSGKTTLFDCISGVHPVSSGRVLLGGEKITGLPPHLIARRGVARTFQVYAATGDLTVEESIMVGCFMGTASPARAKNFARRLMDLLGLSDLCGQRVRELPAAAQKRVTMAAALGTGPRLLLLDEVAAGITPQEMEGIMENIRRFHREMGITIILIEHVMELVMKLCRRVIVLDQGRMIIDGSPGAVAEDPRVVRAYLGKRYMEEQQKGGS